MASTKEMMARAKARKSADRPQGAIIIAPLYPDRSTKFMSVGEYSRTENIDAVFVIIGTVFVADIGEVETCLIVSNNAGWGDEQTEATGKGWWRNIVGKNKFFAWLPLNDITEMTVSGPWIASTRTEATSLRGWFLAEIIRKSGFTDEFKQSLRRAASTDNELLTALDSIAEGFADEVMSA